MARSACAKMARQECANLKRDGCLFTQDGVCPVLEGKRCCVSKAVLSGGNPNTPDTDYFSACVVPLANSRPEYIEAANEYAAITGKRKAMVAIRYCACGTALAKGKQCCESCRRRRATCSQRSWRRARCREKLPKSSA